MDVLGYDMETWVICDGTGSWIIALNKCCYIYCTNSGSWYRIIRVSISTKSRRCIWCRYFCNYFIQQYYGKSDCYSTTLYCEHNRSCIVKTYLWAHGDQSKRVGIWNSI